MDLARVIRIVRDAEDVLETLARDCPDYSHKASDAAHDLGRARRFLKEMQGSR